MKITILIFDDFTSLDIVGPYEVLSKLPDSNITIVGLERKAYSDTHGLKIIADSSIDEISHTDILLVPGGFGIDLLLNNKQIIDWIQKINKTTKWTVSVCSGSLLLAQAGLLNGKKCTTHWKRKKQLSNFDVIIQNERYVQDGKFITSSGVSAGIDMALFLVNLIAGNQTAKIIQLALEYNPSPLFDLSSPDNLPEDMFEQYRNSIV